MHREQVCCDERRIPREPTSWLSCQLDQRLRGLVYASGVAEIWATIVFVIRALSRSF